MFLSALCAWYINFLFGAPMFRSMFVATLVSFVVVLAGLGFGAGNPAEVEAGPEETEPSDIDATDEDAPIVDGVFSEELPVEETDAKSTKVDKFYNGLTSENIAARMEGMYAANVQFTSPFVSLVGRDALAEHYKTLFTNLKSFSLEVTEEFVSGQETVLLWDITYAHPKLNGGETLKTSGVSHLTFANDQVLSQRDYFDAGSMVYEQVTLVGRVVKWVKNKVIGS
jgi:hypothetical protein